MIRIKYISLLLMVLQLYGCVTTPEHNITTPENNRMPDSLRLQYVRMIEQKVESKWLRPTTLSPDQSCEVVVRQTALGDVISVNLQECSSDAAFKNSIERAVWAASPLPPPPNPEVFDNEIRFTFRSTRSNGWLNTTAPEQVAATEQTTVAEQATGRTLTLGGMQFEESKHGEFISWKCRDYSSSWGSTLVEVGNLPLSDDINYTQIPFVKAVFSSKLDDEGLADLYTKLDDSEKKAFDRQLNKMMQEHFGNRLGFVLYDGTNTGDIVIYRRDGLSHRWDWGSVGSNYSFVIKSDDTGLFYDFSTADDDGMKSEADDIFKCRRR